MPNKKNLLIYAHYYIPDTASTGQILRELAEGMLDKFNITVICVVPSYLGIIEDKYKTQKYYEEEINGVKVLRIRVPEFSKTNKKSRVKNIVSYFFGAMGATFKVGKMDYVFSISQPPILGGLLGVWGKWMKHAKYIYNIQDFNPEQVLAVSYTKSKFITDVMMWFDKFSCKRSDLIITVGRDLVETVENRFKGRKVPKTVMINNWIDENEIYPLDESNEKVIAFKEKYSLDNKFVIMYSGNIGLYYDLENLIRVVERFKPGTKTADGREVVFAFVGAGSVLDKLVLYVREHQIDNVTFIPYQDKISNIVERFKELSENWKKLLQEKAQLPEKGFNDKDRKKLTRLKKNFIRDLQDYEYTSISNVSAIEISDDNYLPVIDNFDMKFDSSASDNVRAIWAYTMALLQTSEKCGGNHPGLLIFDEPAQHSIGAVDTKAFFDSILNLGDNCQVIIGITINNADIREVISEIGEEKCNVVNIGEKAFV